MKKKIASVFAALALVVAISGCGENETDTPTVTPPPQQTVDTSATTTTAELAETNPPETEPQTEEANIKIVSHSMSKDYSGADALIIEFEWTNTEDKEANFMTTFTASLYQNGIECESAIMAEGVDSQLLMNDIKPGVTYKVQKAYVLQDNTTANIVVKKLFGSTDLINENIDLGGGAGADNSSSDEIGETSVKLVGHKLSTDYNGDNVLVVDYEFYNGEKEAKAFMFMFADKAFQNGIECDSTVIGCDDIDSQKQMNEIQPGVSYTVTIGYHISDMSDVEIEITGLFGGKTYLSETISLS